MAVHAQKQHARTHTCSDWAEMCTIGSGSLIASFGTLESEIGHTVMEIWTYLALVYRRRRRWRQRRWTDGWRTLQGVEPSQTSYQTANYLVEEVHSSLLVAKTIYKLCSPYCLIPLIQGCWGHSVIFFFDSLSIYINAKWHNIGHNIGHNIVHNIGRVQAPSLALNLQH